MGRLKARHILLNAPLLVGGVIVLGLFVAVLFGPVWAPENPYLSGMKTLEVEGDSFASPPFPPSARYPLGTDQWGRDVLSLLLYGARNTLIASLFVTMARLLLGSVLGAIAGWNEDTLVDRLIMGAIGVLTSLPILITGMLFILALDIRRGITVFIVALCLLGWGEIAQHVRSEFISLRKKPFIEGARATGLTGLQMAVRHVLPNVLPSLVVLGLLEMGAVLMLLGELGFVGIFIGGGIRTTTAADEQITIPSVPEWGAMLAHSRQWALSAPWMVFYPSLAFFVSVMGFNLLGEGLRRLVEEVGVSTSFILSKKMAAVVALVTVATVYIVNNVGPAPFYARLAVEAKGIRAMEDIKSLTEMGGRGTGTQGARQAAEFIAARFEEYGLQAGGDANTYFDETEAAMVWPLEQPLLALVDEGGREIRRFRYRRDYGFVSRGHGGPGEAEAPVTFVAFDPERFAFSYEALKGLDLRGQVAMFVADNAPAEFPVEALIRGAQGLLVVADDVTPGNVIVGEEAEHLRKPTIPIFRITPEVAEAILSEAGFSPDELLRRPSGQEEPWAAVQTGVRVRMSLKLTPMERRKIRNVIGVLPGKDVILDEQAVILAAHYDGPGADPDGTVYPAADDNASGVAVLLEIARLWHEQGFEPRRTIVFAAWDGAFANEAGAEFFWQGKNVVSLLETVAVLELDALTHEGDSLAVHGDPDIADLIRRSASRLDVPVGEAEEPLHPYQFALEGSLPMAVLTRAGPRPVLEEDTIERVNPDRLDEAVKVVNLTMITLAREGSW